MSGNGSNTVPPSGNERPSVPADVHPKTESFFDEHFPHLKNEANTKSFQDTLLTGGSEGASDWMKKNADLSSISLQTRDELKQLRITLAQANSRKALDDRSLLDKLDQNNKNLTDLIKGSHESTARSTQSIVNAIQSSSKLQNEIGAGGEPKIILSAQQMRELLKNSNNDLRKINVEDVRRTVTPDGAPIIPSQSTNKKDFVTPTIVVNANKSDSAATGASGRIDASADNTVNNVNNTVNNNSSSSADSSDRSPNPGRSRNYNFAGPVTISNLSLPGGSANFSGNSYINQSPSQSGQTPENNTTNSSNNINNVNNANSTNNNNTNNSSSNNTTNNTNSNTTNNSNNNNINTNNNTRDSNPVPPNQRQDNYRRPIENRSNISPSRPIFLRGMGGGRGQLSGQSIAAAGLRQAAYGINPLLGLVTDAFGGALPVAKNIYRGARNVGRFLRPRTSIARSPVSRNSRNNNPIQSSIPNAPPSPLSGVLSNLFTGSPRSVSTGRGDVESIQEKTERDVVHAEQAAKAYYKQSVDLLQKILKKLGEGGDHKEGFFSKILGGIGLLLGGLLKSIGGLITGALGGIGKLIGGLVEKGLEKLGLGALAVGAKKLYNRVRGRTTPRASSRAGSPRTTPSTSTNRGSVPNFERTTPSTRPSVGRRVLNSSREGLRRGGSALARGAGKGLKFVGKGLGAALLGSLAVDAVANNTPQFSGKDTLTGAATGAMTGATIGSIVPLVGTGLGAAVGGIAGGLMANADGATLEKAAGGIQSALGNVVETIPKILTGVSSLLGPVIGGIASLGKSAVGALTGSNDEKSIDVKGKTINFTGDNVNLHINGKSITLNGNIPGGNTVQPPNQTPVANQVQATGNKVFEKDPVNESIFSRLVKFFGRASPPPPLAPGGPNANPTDPVAENPRETRPEVVSENETSSRQTNRAIQPEVSARPETSVRETNLVRSNVSTTPPTPAVNNNVTAQPAAPANDNVTARPATPANDNVGSRQSPSSTADTRASNTTEPTRPPTSESTPPEASEGWWSRIKNFFSGRAVSGAVRAVAPRLSPLTSTLQLSSDTANNPEANAARDKQTAEQTQKYKDTHGGRTGLSLLSEEQKIRYNKEHNVNVDEMERQSVKEWEEQQKIKQQQQNSAPVSSQGSTAPSRPGFWANLGHMLLGGRKDGPSFEEKAKSGFVPGTLPGGVSEYGAPVVPNMDFRPSEKLLSEWAEMDRPRGPAVDVVAEARKRREEREKIDEKKDKNGTDSDWMGLGGAIDALKGFLPKGMIDTLTAGIGKFKEGFTGLLSGDHAGFLEPKKEKPGAWARNVLNKYTQQIGIRGEDAPDALLGLLGGPVSGAASFASAFFKNRNLKDKKTASDAQAVDPSSDVNKPDSARATATPSTVPTKPDTQANVARGTESPEAYSKSFLETIFGSGDKEPSTTQAAEPFAPPKSDVQAATPAPARNESAANPQASSTKSDTKSETKAETKASPSANDPFAGNLRAESGNRQLTAQGTPVTSPRGAIGIAQVMPETARETARKHGIVFDDTKYKTDAAYNENLGRLYHTDQMETFGNNKVLADAAYNAGPGRVRQWIKEFGDPRTGQISTADWAAKIPIPETREYVKRTGALAAYQDQKRPEASNTERQKSAVAKTVIDGASVKPTTADNETINASDAPSFIDRAKNFVEGIFGNKADAAPVDKSTVTTHGTVNPLALGPGEKTDRTNATSKIITRDSGTTTLSGRGSADSTKPPITTKDISGKSVTPFNRYAEPSRVTSVPLGTPSPTTVQASQMSATDQTKSEPSFLERASNFISNLFGDKSRSPVSIGAPSDNKTIVRNTGTTTLSGKGSEDATKPFMYTKDVTGKSVTPFNRYAETPVIRAESTNPKQQLSIQSIQPTTSEPSFFERAGNWVKNLLGFKSDQSSSPSGQEKSSGSIFDKVTNLVKNLVNRPNRTPQSKLNQPLGNFIDSGRWEVPGAETSKPPATEADITKMPAHETSWRKQNDGTVVLPPPTSASEVNATTADDVLGSLRAEASDQRSGKDEIVNAKPSKMPAYETSWRKEAAAISTVDEKPVEVKAEDSSTKDPIVSTLSEHIQRGQDWEREARKKYLDKRYADVLAKRKAESGTRSELDNKQDVIVPPVDKSQQIIADPEGALPKDAATEKKEEDARFLADYKSIIAKQKAEAVAAVEADLDREQAQWDVESAERKDNRSSEAKMNTEDVKALDLSVNGSKDTVESDAVKDRAKKLADSYLTKSAPGVPESTSKLASVQKISTVGEPSEMMLRAKELAESYKKQGIVDTGEQGTWDTTDKITEQSKNTKGIIINAEPAGEKSEVPPTITVNANTPSVPGVETGTWDTDLATTGVMDQKPSYIPSTPPTIAEQVLSRPPTPPPAPTNDGAVASNMVSTALPKQNAPSQSASPPGPTGGNAGSFFDIHTAFAPDELSLFALQRLG